MGICRLAAANADLGEDPGAMLPRATGLVSAYGPVVRCRLILQFLGSQDRLTTVRGAIRALIRLAWDVHVEREEPDL